MQPPCRSQVIPHGRGCLSSLNCCQRSDSFIRYKAWQHTESVLPSFIQRLTSTYYCCHVQTRTLPSCLLDMISLPSAENPMLVTESSWPFRSATILPVAASHTRTDPLLPVASSLPSGLQA